MRLTDILKEAEKLKGEDIHTLFLWAVDAEFTPLILDTRLGKDNLEIHFKPVSYRKVMRFYIAQELNNRSQIYSRLYLQVPLRQIYYELLLDGISQVIVNDEVRSKDFVRNHPQLERVVFRIVSIVNGLDPAVSPEFQKQLKLLENISYAYFAEVSLAPEWAAPLILSYQIFREGGVWSKPVPVDEPYLLWQAWLAIARGEKKYYDVKFSSTSTTSAPAVMPPAVAPSSQGEIPSHLPIQTLASLKDAIDVDGLMEVLRNWEAKKK